VRVAKTIYLIDGHSQIYRAYYAPFRNLSSPTGEPTRATYVFCQMLLNLIRDYAPDYLVMVLDADESKLLRKGVYPEYKAHRPPPPEDLLPQERRIVSLMQSARVPLLRAEGFEADDIIATLTRRFASDELQVCIVSRDKDLDQLLGRNVTLFDPMKDEVITAERLVELKGWRPEQAIDAQVLVGDTSDNVPGVPGIGAKTAGKLLQQYGSVAEILAHAGELPPRQREGLLAAAPRLDMIRHLVTLVGDVPLRFDLEEAACARFDWAAVRPVFEELGFRRLAEQLPGQATKVAASQGTSGKTPSLFTERPAEANEARAPTLPQPLPRKEGGFESEAARLAASLREPRRGDYHLVNAPETFAHLVAELSQQAEFALDTETSALGPIDCDLVGLSLAWEVGRAYYVPVRNVFGQTLPLESVRAGLAPLLADATKRKVGQQLKYDLNVLRGVGFPVAGPLWDTMVAAFVVDPSRGSYGLDALALALLGHTKIPTTDLIGKGRDQLRMDQVPLERIAEYACEDADYTWRLRQLLEPQLAPLGVERLFYDLEMPLVAVLTDMENDGVALDTELLREIGRQMASRVSAIEEQVQRLAGTTFNLDSPKQLAEVIFERLGFRVVRRTKTTRSTDADTLEALRKETQHPIFPLLLEYREIQKLRGTYVDALPTQLSKRTGRIHTSYHQTGTVTGRLSSSEPNLQNIPIRTEMGRQIRRAFVPRSKGELLVVADYSQIELRVLAHFCEDPALMRAFAEDQDIHAFVAAQVNNVPLGDVTKDMRSRAKAVNFGIIYGQTAFGLSQATGLSRSEAQAFIAAYFARYPRIREFIDRCLAEARRDGLVRTILGRRRPIENLRSQNPSIRAQAERLAVNTVIQGSAADLIKVAMIQLHGRIHEERLPLRILLQVHDELVCEAPRSVAPAMAEITRVVMTGAMKLRVPLKVDVACGENWLDAK
jgi:DNA polymerase-1